MLREIQGPIIREKLFRLWLVFHERAKSKIFLLLFEKKCIWSKNELKYSVGDQKYSYYFLKFQSRVM